MKKHLFAIAACMMLAACGWFGNDDETPPAAPQTAFSTPDDEEAAVNARESDAAGEHEDETASAAATSQPTRQAAPKGTAALSGSFTAMSKTAMSITGDIRFKADVISFGNGQTITTAPMYMVSADKPYSSTQKSWADLLFVPEQSQVEMREVTGVALNDGARELCGKRDVRWVAIGTERDGKSIDVVAVALLSGSEEPGPEAPEGNLCATYSFSRD